MAVITPIPKTQFLDAAGAPLAGGLVYTYQAGTTTPQATYTDSTGATPNSNPIVLDARGEANIWLGEATYKMTLCNSLNVEIWTVDYISAPTTAVSPVLTGNVTISTDSSGPALKITQTGTGPVLRVQDETDPDSTPFIITSSGYVGIGTAAPGNALDVTGGKIQVSSAAGVSQALIYGDTSNSYITAEADRTLILQTNSTPRVYINSSGVGVGVASPTVALDVTGAIKASTAITAGTTIASGTTITAGSSITATTTATVGTTLYTDVIAEKTSAAGVTIDGVLCKDSQVDPSNRVITASSVTTTNGATSYDFTGIPSWVRRVTIIFKAVSIAQTLSSLGMLVRLGTSGGFATTGYVSTSLSTGVTANSTAGMIVYLQATSYTLSGTMVINLLDSSAHSYVSTHVGKISTTLLSTGGGDVTLSGVLTQIRLTTSSGDAFTGGTASIIYE